MQLRAFIQQVAGVGAVSLVDRVVAVALGIIFARWLGPAEFGSYSFVIAAVGLLILPARLGLPELMTRDIAASRGRQSEYCISETIKKGYLLVGTTSFTLVALGHLVLHFIPQTPLSELMKFGLWLILPTVFFEVTIGILRGFGRTLAFQFYGTLLLSSLTLTLSAGLMLAIDSYDAPVAVVGRFLAVTLLVIVASFHLASLMKKVSKTDNLSSRPACDLIKTGFGFMANALVYMALMRVDLLVLGLISDAESVGLYRVAVEGGVLVAFAYGAATTVLAPEYARLFAAGEKQQLQILVRQSGRAIMAVGAIAAIPLILFSREIITLVFGAEYAGAAFALSILAVGHLCTFIFGDPVFLLNMTGHHNRITMLVMAGLAIATVLCFMLIPSFGVVGAALAASIALVAYRALAFREVHRAIGINCAVIGRYPKIVHVQNFDSNVE